MAHQLANFTTGFNQTILTDVLDAEPTLRLTIAELLAASLPEDERVIVEGLLTEASVRSLWADATRAFPQTRRRQHVINRVSTREVKWQPFPRLKTLLATSRVIGEQHTGQKRKLYRTNIMFRDVEFSAKARRGMLKITTRGSSPRTPKGGVFFEKLSFDDSVRVRCNCPDFRYRFNHETEAETPSALFGPKAPPYTPPNPERYRGPANPSGLPGVCKHIMNVGLALHKAGAVKLRG